MTEYRHKLGRHSAPQATLMALFVAFVCGYVGWMQCDTLAQTLHILSGGHAHYNRVAGTMAILAVAVIAQAIASKLTAMPARLYAMTYIPPAIFLCVLTDLVPHYTARKLIVYAATVTVLTVACIKLRQRMAAGSEPRKTLCLNIAAISAIMVATGVIGNTQPVSHYELKAERYLQEGNPDMALKVGTGETSKRLTVARAYALALKGKLNEQLFTFPMPSGLQTLLPQLGDSIKTVLPPMQIYRWLGIASLATGNATSEQILETAAAQPALAAAHPRINDYLIATLLVNKHIDSFAHVVKSTAPQLQKHTKEAIVLYQHIRTNPVVTIRDNLTETNYADFMAIRKSAAQDAAKKLTLKAQYGDTYWWYYYYI